MVDKGCEFYNRSIKSWLQHCDIESSSINKRKSVIAERFVRTLKSKIYKYMTAVKKNVYIDKLADIVNEYNNTNHRKIKEIHINVNSSMNIDFCKENNKKNSKFEVGDHERMSKCWNIFAKGYTPNWTEEVLLIKKGKKYCAVGICKRRP